jgi:hypothetical protein
MKLNELHVDQFRPGVIRERMTVAGIFPTVAGDLVGAADAAGGEHDGLCFENLEASALALVGQNSGHPLAVLEQRDHRVFHVHVDALVNAVILQRANEFQAGAIADVRQARVLVPAEIALKDTAIRRAVEHRPPGLQFTHAGGGFLGVQLGHAPVIHVLAAAHGVREVDFPIVAVIHVGQSRRDAAFGHHGVGLAEQRFANHAHPHAGRRGLDRRAQSRSARADDQHVVFVSFVVGHGRSLSR